MITSRNLRDALADLIKVKAKLNLRVFFNQVNNCAEDYVWVRLRPKRRDEGFGYMQRTIRVDFQVVLAPDDNGEVQHTRLYDIIDALDEATCNSIPVTDRWLVVLDTETIIFDNILTYTFLLDFTDCFSTLPPEITDYEFMRQLEIDFGNAGLVIENED